MSGCLLRCQFLRPVPALLAHFASSPARFGCGSDACAGSGAHGVSSGWFRGAVSVPTGQQCAGLPKTGNLGIDGGEKIGRVHTDQCNPT